MSNDCTYCGSDVTAHDPVFVAEGVDERQPVGRFCNYACLTAYVDEEELTSGACCRI
ncbi:hypothetical protein [Halomicrococcus sp. NG-SE-24]|uniref:hypothetical protein n=1 Tax=Halomicrococcus sp. NG-SE-24 TaxID=3436928 RepID=UPI003D98BC0D